MTLLSFLDWLTRFVTGSPSTYGIVFGASALDAFVPVVPSETIVIAAGALAAHGHLIPYLVAAAAAVGAFVGDNVSYALGRLVGDPLARVVFRGEKGRKQLESAQRLLQRHGSIIIVAARFIPGGRTATTFASGTFDFRWRSFVVYDAVAAAVWGVYSTAIGYFGGTVFQHSLWKALLLGFGIAVLVSLAVDGYRRFQRRRGRDVFGQEEQR